MHAGAGAPPHPPALRHLTRPHPAPPRAASDHTKSHKSLRGIGEKKVKSEIEGGKETLTSCGVPADDVVGLRAPFLNTDETVRQVLAENNFLYER